MRLSNYLRTLSLPRPHRGFYCMTVPLIVWENVRGYDVRDVLFLFFSCRMDRCSPPLDSERALAATLASSLIHAIPTTDSEILSLEEMPERSSTCLLSYRRLLFSPLLFFSRKCTDDDAHGNPYDAPRQ